MNQNDKSVEKCRAILKHYGFATQKEKLIKECEELIKAARGEDCDSFIEELADVSVMTAQMFMSLDENQQEQFNATIDLKLCKTLQRIKSESDT